MKVVLNQLSSIPPRFLGGTKMAAKSTFCFELFILTCVSNVLDMYLNNLCACLSMSSLINLFLRPKTRRLGDDRFSFVIFPPKDGGFVTSGLVPDSVKRRMILLYMEKVVNGIYCEHINTFGINELHKGQ